MLRRRIAVVGGTGFIGSHLTEHLIEQGHTVLVVARSDRRLDNLEDVRGQFDFVKADIKDRSGLISALTSFGPETVYHLAAEADCAESLEHVRACIENNTSGTINVLDAAIQARAELFVYADSSKVYGNGPVPFCSSQAEDPVCSYAIAKSAAWRLCKLIAEREQIRVVSLRPTFVYGPRQNFNFITYVERAVLAGQPIRIQGGKQTRDLLYIQDAVRCFSSILNSQDVWGKAIPIGSGTEISIADLCKEILMVLDSDAEVMINGLPPRSTEMWRSYTDNSQIQELTGWSPKVSLQEGLTKTLQNALYSANTNRKLRAVAG
jgi:UDP-glucose 4-epimerase